MSEVERLRNDVKNAEAANVTETDKVDDLALFPPLPTVEDEEYFDQIQAQVPTWDGFTEDEKDDGDLFKDCLSFDEAGLDWHRRNGAEHVLAPDRQRLFGDRL